MKPVRLDELAEEEAFAAAIEIEHVREGWGLKFLEELDERQAFIADNPEVSPDMGPWPGVKRVPMHRFPYWIVYRVRPEEIVVLAVAHQRRRPGFWKERVED